MFSESAELYDLIYSRFKDYPAEARQLAELIRRERPGARTVLDVACGTAEHARLLTAEHGFMPEYVHGPDEKAELLRQLNEWRAERGEEPLSPDEEGDHE